MRRTAKANRSLFWFLLAALLIHLGLGWFGRVVAYDIYHGAADVGQYHQVGVDLAEQFRHGVFAINLPGGFGGTNWPGVVAGSLYAVTGPTTVGGYLFFAWLGFWGCFFFYRAFNLAVPEGRARTYRRLLFLLPSLAFWSSYMGKDSWMVFGMGIAAFGIARILTGNVMRGLIPVRGWHGMHAGRASPYRGHGGPGVGRRVRVHEVRGRAARACSDRESVVPRAGRDRRDLAGRSDAGAS